MEGRTSGQPQSSTPSASCSPCKKKKQSQKSRVVYQITLDVDGKKIEVQIGISPQEGNNYDVFINLEDKVNRENMQLKLMDISSIEQPESILGTSYGRFNTSIQGQDKIRLFRLEGENRSITMNILQYAMLQEYSPSLRFVVESFMDKNIRKLETIKLFVLAIMDEEIAKLYTLNIFEGSLEKDIRKARPFVVERMSLIEKTLLIPHNETMNTLHNDLFLHWYQNFKLTNVFQNILKFIEKNELK